MLHAYQPPWQFLEVIKRIVEECYLPQFEFFSKIKTNFTVNINYSLLEQLKSYGYGDLLERIREAVDKGSIEITGTAAYHPILPLIPAKEIRRQIWLNEKGVAQILERDLGKGFFPPELAYSSRILPFVRKNYSWIITEDVPYGLVYGSVPYNFIPAQDGFAIFLRSSLWSRKIALEKFGNRKATASEIVNWLSQDLENWFKGKDGYVILAMDIETFGHHISEYRSFLPEFVRAISSKKKMKLVKVSELLDLFPLKETVVPPGSWSTSPHDFWRKEYFPLWKSRTNKAHRLLWKLVELALSSLGENNQQIRELMDKSLNSCQFWWLSSYHWNPKIALMNVPALLKIIKEAGSSLKFQQAQEIVDKLKRITNLK